MGGISIDKSIDIIITINLIIITESEWLIIVTLRRIIRIVITDYLIRHQSRTLINKITWLRMGSRIYRIWRVCTSIIIVTLISWIGKGK